MSRAVAPDVPHHVTQRGNRRQQTFFSGADYVLYTELMARACRRYGVEVWAYCLMPNHGHLIAVPSTPDALRLAIGDAHRRYTSEVNRREGWTGHLWQGRFASFAMDARYTVAAARYIELNPVRAGLATYAGEYRWSSARAHLAGCDDRLVSVAPMLALVPDWPDFIREPPEDLAFEFHKHENTGRPLGSQRFIERVENSLGRLLTPRRPGPPPSGLSAADGDFAESGLG